jgi:ATP-binding cassette subfamily C protein CydC
MRFWFELIVKTNLKRISIGILLTLITMLSGIALLMLSGWFISATALAGISIAAGLVITFDMYVPGSGIRFFALSRTISRYIERIYNHDTILRLISLFRVTLFRRLSNMSLQQLRESSDSEWLSRLTADIDALDSILVRYILPPIAALLLIIGLSVFISVFWFEFALYSGLFMLLCLSLSVFYTIKSTEASSSSACAILNHCRTQVIEHLNGSVELQSYHLMDVHQRGLDTRLQQLDVAQNTLSRKTVQLQSLLDWVLNINLFVVSVALLSAVNSSVITGPQAIMLVMMFLGVNEVLQTFVMQFSTWGKTDFSAGRLAKLDDSGAVSFISNESTKHNVNSVCSLAVRLVDEQKVSISQQQAVNLTLCDNQMLNIIGQSGSGKSSFADLLAGVTALNSKSEILINDRLHISDIAKNSWHQKVTYLEQANTIFAGTLGYNLVMGLSTVDEQYVWSVLKQLELAQWVNSLPQGLNTWLGETGGKVSGGQARRICLARLLLRDPQLIILDEPFNGIDANMANRIWKNISPWLSTRMVILLTHQPAEYLAKNKALYLTLDADSSS